MHSICHALRKCHYSSCSELTGNETEGDFFFLFALPFCLSHVLSAFPVSLVPISFSLSFLYHMLGTQTHICMQNLHLHVFLFLPLPPLPSYRQVFITWTCLSKIIILTAPLVPLLLSLQNKTCSGVWKRILISLPVLTNPHTTPFNPVKSENLKSAIFCSC